MRKLIILFASIVAIVVLDQWTKSYIFNNFQLGESIPVIDHFFSITYVKNTGAAFGMGAHFSSFLRYAILLILPVLACLWLIWLIFSSYKKNIWEASSYTLILSGAIGNLIDRFSLGYVVDFLDFFYGRSHFPAFNVADSCITVGATILAIVHIIDWHKRKKCGQPS